MSTSCFAAVSSSSTQGTIAAVITESGRICFDHRERVALKLFIFDQVDRLAALTELLGDEQTEAIALPLDDAVIGIFVDALDAARARLAEVAAAADPDSPDAILYRLAARAMAQVEPDDGDQ